MEILVHMRSHEKFQCGKYEKSLKYEILKEKHLKSSYCHYFNNHKQCPYDESCIFMHKYSELSKYGNRFCTNMRTRKLFWTALQLIKAI